jgi:hypothetical protein
MPAYSAWPYILVPTSLRDQWEKALTRWLDIAPTHIAAVASGQGLTTVPFSADASAVFPLTPLI